MGLQGTDEKAKSENQKHQMVFTVPRVRTDFKQGLYITARVGGNLLACDQEKILFSFCKDLYNK